MLRTIGFARVSSREQALEGNSLDVQLSSFERYTSLKGEELVEVFRVAESAKRSEARKEFDKALARLDETIKAPKNKIQHQIALFFKGMVIMDAKNDAKAAIVELEAAKALDEGSPIGKQIGMILPQLKKMAEQKKDEAKESGK